LFYDGDTGRMVPIDEDDIFDDEPVEVEFGE
jgi:hypothetical protein